jgi:multiple sugar transport system substrate-binding protein
MSMARRFPLIAWAGVIAVLAVFVWGMPEPRTLRIAIHQGIEGVALKQAAMEFAKANGIVVSIEDFPYDRLYELALKEIGQSSTAYDVFMADDPWLPALYAAGRDARGLAPVELPDDGCKPLDFVPSTLRVAKYVRENYDESDPTCSDTFYGVPYVGNSQLFVRKESTVRQKVSWNDLLSDKGYFLRSGPGNPIVTDFMPILWQESPDSFKSDTTNGVRLVAGSTQALVSLKGLGTRERSNLSITSFDDLDLAVHMVRGTATSSIVWSAWAMAMERRVPGQLNFSELPDMKPELGVWLLTIPANSSHHDEAKLFLKTATTKEAFLEAAKHGNPPPRKSVFQDPAYKDAVSFSDKQLASLDQARARPRTKYWKQVETVLGRCLSTIYESSVPDEKPTDAEKAVSAVIDTANIAIKTIMAEQKPAEREAYLDAFTCRNISARR